MKSLGIWQVGDATLSRAAESEIDLERHLEDWIEQDPSLLQEGLVSVGRQVRVQSGPLDLLAIDPQGRWVVIEIKRGYLDERAVMQVIDYAACLRELSASDFREKLEPHLASRDLDLDVLLEQRGVPDALDPEQRELLLFVVGSGQGGSIERMVRFLSDPYGIPISVVRLQVFALNDGCKLLVREVTEQETTVATARQRSKVSVDDVLKLAEGYGTRAQLQQAVDFATSKGLPIHPWATSLMFTPPCNAARCLFTVWAKPGKTGLKVYVALEPLTESYGIDRAELEQRLGPDGWRFLDQTGLDELLAAIDGLDLGAR